MKKILTFSILGLLLFSSLVLAQGVNYDRYNTQNELKEMEQIQNRFQERYNFTCEGTCTQHKMIGLDTLVNRLEVRTQKKFLFWKVDSVDTYDINENGEIIQAKYNFWSRLLNRNKAQ